jgi:hypothetical protein
MKLAFASLVDWRVHFDPQGGRIKSDTPPSRFTTLTACTVPQNIGFHYVWTVAYPLP